MSVNMCHIEPMFSVGQNSQAGVIDAHLRKIGIALRCVDIRYSSQNRAPEITMVAMLSDYAAFNRAMSGANNSADLESEAGQEYRMRMSRMVSNLVSENSKLRAQLDNIKNTQPSTYTRKLILTRSSSDGKKA